MSYTKHTWVDGELVTAAKMNNIENGIEEASSGGGVLVAHEVGGALDKTYKQIVDALHANGVILEWTHETGIEVYRVIDYGNVNNVYLITFHTDSSMSSKGGKSHYYVAESENGYPTNDD